MVGMWSIHRPKNMNGKKDSNEKKVSLRTIEDKNKIKDTSVNIFFQS